MKVGRDWRGGTAHLLPDDDARARMRSCAARNDAFVRLAARA